jgi:hypothetical protein
MRISDDRHTAADRDDLALERLEAMESASSTMLPKSASASEVGK